MLFEKKWKAREIEWKISMATIAPQLRPICERNVFFAFAHEVHRNDRLHVTIFFKIVDGDISIKILSERYISIVTISHKGIIPIAVCKLFLDNFQLIYHIFWQSKRESRIMQMERNTSTSNQLTFYLIFKKWTWGLIMFLETTKRRVSSLLKHFPAWKWRNFPQFFNIISTEKYFLVCWRDVMILPPRVWYG